MCACMRYHADFMPQVWLYSIQSEVFSLNNMLCACTIYLAVRCVSSKDVAPLRLGALFVGLCSCNQHTSIFLFTPAVVWIYINRFSDVHANLLPMIACGLAGLSPYLYIPFQVCGPCCVALKTGVCVFACLPTCNAEPLLGRHGQLGRAPHACRFPAPLPPQGKNNTPMLRSTWFSCHDATGLRNFSAGKQRG